MSWDLIFDHNIIDLYVKGRISAEDANRQKRTAREIIERLRIQPGIILADEVGMGKTFVALAVAASVHFHDRLKRPVVVMVPSNLKAKWPRDFEIFKERCLAEHLRKEFRYGKAEKAEEFLKYLDDPQERRKSIIFLIHGAMSRGLSDGWIKLALIQKSLSHRHHTHTLKKSLYRCLGELLYMKWAEKKNEDIWERLLNAGPGSWLHILHKKGIDPEHDSNPATDDDPVSQILIEAMKKIDTKKIFKSLDKIPIYKTKHYSTRLKEARAAINAALKKVWIDCMEAIDIKLPLLILDEAHHLKNAHTQLASLFMSKEAHKDAEHLRNYLADVFDRMLFLTATPFQLGHHELCNVLTRFSGISWSQETTPDGGLTRFTQELEMLKTCLDQAQIQALLLDKAWGNLHGSDLRLRNKKYHDVEKWWQDLKKNVSHGSDIANHVVHQFQQTKEVMYKTENLLKKWVIRHTKNKFFKHNNICIARRRRLVGENIIQGREYRENVPEKGIAITGDVLLPFLISARVTTITPESRPVFAEGLSSSYEAFIFTRKKDVREKNLLITDFDDIPNLSPYTDGMVHWYLNELEELLPIRKGSGLSHPKLKHTVKKAVELWQEGEKVLIFCHYIATGKALRKHISDEMRRIIKKRAASKLKCRTGQVSEKLDLIGKRFFSEGSGIRKAVDEEIERILNNYTLLQIQGDDIIDIVRRYLRTPSFLVRYFPLGMHNIGKKMVLKALRTKDRSGFSLKDMICMFFDFLQNQCKESEMKEYIAALKSLQSGDIRGKDVMSSFTEDEREDEKTDLLMPNVRLVVSSN